MFRRFAFCCLLLGLYAAPVWASCVFRDDGKTVPEIQVLDHWSARHVNEGAVSGCLLQIRETGGGMEYLAYTAYDFICALGREEKIAVHRGYACCDTGDQGDYVCGIKPVNPLAMLRQTDISIVPARPDKRAIPNLMDRLAKSEWVGVRNITERLAEYAAVPELKEDILALRPRLRELMEAAKHPDKKAAIAALLLQFGDKAEAAAPDRLDLALGVLQGAAQWRELSPDEMAALETIKEHPEMGEKIVPVLVDILRRGSHREDTKRLMLETLPHFGAALQPHLGQVHYILDDDLFVRGSVDAAMAEDEKNFDWFKANHRDRDNHEDMRQYTETQRRSRKDMEDRARRSDAVMPLWRKLVCAAFPMPTGAVPRRVIWDEDIWSRDGDIPPVDCPAK